jgi:hypothetical protein
MINDTADHMTSASYRRGCQVSPSLAPPCSRRGSRSGGGSVRGPAGSLSEALAGTTGPVHCAGRADGLGPQSATCSPGFRDAPRFARVARVLPGAALSRSETLTLAPHAPRLGPQIRMGGVASTSSTQARTVKIRMLRTDGFGYPESAQRCSNPLRHPSRRVSPTLRPDRCLPRGPAFHLRP